MKKFVFKNTHILSAFAMFMTVSASNRTCVALLHEPELPKSAKKLRKF